MMQNHKQQKLIDQALAARKMAYAPYSNYSVGAALLLHSGKIYTGCNIENAAYPTTMCAERVAIYKAVSEGERDFEAIVVATADGGSPCGSCRQVMAEFSLDMPVIIVNDTGQVMQETTVRELLPAAFTPANLGK